MSTEARKPARTKDLGRTVYRLTGAQVFRMIEAGILPDGVDVELWNGVLYQLRKDEPHNFVVGQTGDLLRPLLPPGYYLREEKSSRFGEYHLPEPDLAVARGCWGDDLSNVPPLSRMALLVEVCVTTDHADRVVKLQKYAEAGVPVYWVIDVARKRVEVHEKPEEGGSKARYSSAIVYAKGQDFPVVVDGREVGRLAVSELRPDDLAPGTAPHAR